MADQDEVVVAEETAAPEVEAEETVEAPVEEVVTPEVAA